LPPQIGWHSCPTRTCRRPADEARLCAIEFPIASQARGHVNEGGEQLVGSAGHLVHCAVWNAISFTLLDGCAKRYCEN